MEDFEYYAVNVYATNQNFPDESMEDIIEDLENAFGLRFIYDSMRNTMDIIYIKDILQSSEILTLDAEIIGMQLKKKKEKTIRLTYGQEDDTAFNYDDYTNVKEKTIIWKYYSKGRLPMIPHAIRTNLPEIRIELRWTRIQAEILLCLR